MFCVTGSPRVGCGSSPRTVGHSHMERLSDQLFVSSFGNLQVLSLNAAGIFPGQLTFN